MDQPYNQPETSLTPPSNKKKIMLVIAGLLVLCIGTGLIVMYGKYIKTSTLGSLDEKVVIEGILPQALFSDGENTLMLKGRTEKGDEFQTETKFTIVKQSSEGPSTTEEPTLVSTPIPSIEVSPSVQLVPSM